MMKNPHPARRRVYMLLGFFGAFLLLFFAVLYDAQVVHGSENRAKSITSNTASETVTASRGIITDRNGKVLVSNRLAYTLVFDKSAFGKDGGAGIQHQAGGAHSGHRGRYMAGGVAQRRKDRLCGLRGSGLLHERSGGQGRRREGL